MTFVNLASDAFCDDVFRRTRADRCDLRGGDEVGDALGVGAGGDGKKVRSGGGCTMCTADTPPGWKYANAAGGDGKK